ncbi:MAG: transposase domain-containing protein [Sphingomonas sp.]
MKSVGGKIWFTAAELAELALPGLPKAKRKINEDHAARWALQVDASGAPLARPRQARGGGLEFHIDVLPAAARAELVKRGVAIGAHVPATPETTLSTRWSWYAGLTDDARAKAEFRARLIAEVEALGEAGIKPSAAVPSVATGAGVGASTLWGWIALVSGVKPSDRLPHLAPQHKGGGAEAEINDDAWQLLLSDYLRPEEPPFSSCYRRLERYAEKHGLKLPHARSLRRKIEREIDPRVVIMRRKGADALRNTLPPLQRTVAELHAMQCVNVDGHKWDVFVNWGKDAKGEDIICRPITVGIQDVYSRKILGWSTGKAETAIETRLAFAHVFSRYGIPLEAVMDNGRAFASKWISGGALSRFRFTIRDDEPLGILTALNIKIHWTLPYRGQSKPIERAWKDFCSDIAKHPAFAGAYTGNKPDAKPENYRSRAVPLAKFLEVVADEIGHHNARGGRRTEMAAGLRSIDDVFNESYAVAPISRATPDQLRLALLTADNVSTDKRSGAIKLHGNRYWCDDLALIAGDPVTVRFDPDDLHAPLHVFTREGEYLCQADLWEATGFLDVAAAKERARLESRFKKATKEKAAALQLLDADDIATRYEITANTDLPTPSVTRLVRHRGQTAVQLKTTAQRAPRAASDAAQAALMDRMGAGLGKLRAVK